jgi:hypothetical protein
MRISIAKGRYALAGSSRADANGARAHVHLYLLLSDGVVVLSLPEGCCDVTAPAPLDP